MAIRQNTRHKKGGGNGTATAAATIAVAVARKKSVKQSGKINRSKSRSSKQADRETIDALDRVMLDAVATTATSSPRQTANIQSGSHARVSNAQIEGLQLALGNIHA